MNQLWAGGMSRRGVLRAAAGSLGAAAVAACGGAGQPAPGGAATKPARSVPIAIWARGASDKLVFDKIADVVATQAPHLAVSTEVTDAINDKLVVALAGGGAP